MKRQPSAVSISAADRLAALLEFDHFIREENGFDNGDPAENDDPCPLEISYRFLPKNRCIDSSKSDTLIHRKQK
jgi:hypothetical protein